MATLGLTFVVQAAHLQKVIERMQASRLHYDERSARTRSTSL